MKTVNVFFYNGSAWKNAVGFMAQQLVNRIHASDLRVELGKKECDGQLIHYQAFGPAAQGMRPGLMSVHQISPRMPGRMLEDMAPALRRHLGVVVLTHDMAEQVRGVTKRPVYVIPGGVHERFTPALLAARLERVAREPFTVGLVGHQRHHKFDLKGREALEGVIQRCPQYRYRICGHGWGDLGAEQRALGRDVEVTERPYEEMPDFYRGLDVLLCLSREEGGCLPILEVLACGVPVISTRVGYAMLDLSSVVRRVGFIGDDYLADTKEVCDELATQATYRAGTARHADRIAGEVSDLTWQRFADRHAALYRELLSNA